MRSIQIIIDGSGSLSVLGKASALDYVLSAAVRQVVWRGGAPELFLWQADVVPIDEAGWAETELAGTANADALASFLQALPARDGALVLTDGIGRGGATLQEAAAKMAAELVFVAVGADADLDELAAVAPVYPAEDVVTAVASLTGAPPEE